MLPREIPDPLRPCDLRARPELRLYRRAVHRHAARSAKAVPAGNPATEIMEDVPALYSFFKRTELQPIGPLSNEALIERLGELEQVLCIVNTKSTPAIFTRRSKMKTPSA